jgi:nitrogen-specific signal transduction histidine kinase/DNA-binding response OmpR family regulator
MAMAKKVGRILIVEDDEVDQTAFKKFFDESSVNYDYIMTDTVKEAKEILKTNSFDTVLVDYILTDGDAFDLVEDCKETPMIIVTGAYNPKLTARAKKQEIFDFLIKDTKGHYLKTLPVTMANAIRRNRIEAELMHYREKLEDLVKERTAEIQAEILEREKAEKALRETKAFNFALFQYNPIETIVVNLEGKVNAYNLAKEKSGDKLPVIGDVMYKDYAGKHEIDMCREMMECIRKGITKNYPELKYKEKYLSISISPFPKGAIIACQDVTERIRAEKDKEKIQNQLLQAQKMEAIGILAGGIAHDFNNIMTAIQGFTDMAILKVDKSSTLYSDLQEVKDASTHAGDLTRQLLLFSRRQPMEIVSLNMNETINNLLKMLHRLLGEDVGISTDLDAECVKIMADKGNMEQVIMNLAINARDAMPEGGKLSIKTENSSITKSYCKMIPEAKVGEYVRLSISDTGVGIDYNIIQHIFEPFFTTKGVGKGTGLGLSVVYGIVKQHNGWINVYTERNIGTSFHVYLPVVTPSGKKKNAKEISSELFHGKGERILIVEDAKNVLEFSQMALTKVGYKVFVAESVHEAHTIFKKEKGKFHLILSDVVLPDGNGIDLIESFLQEKVDMHIILSSGYSDHKSQWPVIRDKGYRFLQKPYSLTDLITAVGEVLSAKLKKQ